MKHLKKLAGCLLALVMILTMSNVAVVNAANNTENGYDTSGSITIEDAVSGQVYRIYRVLDLESYDSEKGAYAYKANPQWATWLSGQNNYISTDNQGYVTWKDGADAVTFAKNALNYAKSNSGISCIDEKTASAKQVVFDNLKPGYYLLDTTLGTLCSLDTANPDVIVAEKNEVPDIDKQVQEDSDQSWGTENTAQIGDTVNFKTTIHAKKGAQGYVLHDAMSAGLTLNTNSIKVQAGGSNLTAGDYTVSTTGLNDGCDFEITFSQTYLDTITGNTDIVVTYSAVLNEDAKIYSDPNTNKTKLNYGDSSTFETTEKETKTYSFSFDVIKTDGNKKLLTGAKFELYDAKKNGNKIALVDEGKGIYRVATSEEQTAENFTSAVMEAGKVTVKGLDANTTYWLEETKAPDGYNKLAERVEVAIQGENLSATLNNDNTEWVSGGVHIVNKTGSLIPSTGGMGTTVLYMAGGVLVIAAGALLIFRKRMHMDK